MSNFDGNAAERRDDLRQQRRQTLQATLAAGALDFTPYISTFRLLRQRRARLEQAAVRLNSLSSTDLDMRLSAARVTVARPDWAAPRRRQSARRRAGAERRRGADVWRHRQGLVRVARSDAVARRQGTVLVHRRRFAILRQRMFGVTKLSRPRQPQCLADGVRIEPVRLAQSLDGTAALIGHDGAIGGFNVEQLPEAAGAPAAVRRRQPSQRLDALRQI